MAGLSIHRGDHTIVRHTKHELYMKTRCFFARQLDNRSTLGTVFRRCRTSYECQGVVFACTLALCTVFLQGMMPKRLRPMQWHLKMWCTAALLFVYTVALIVRKPGKTMITYTIVNTLCTSVCKRRAQQRIATGCQYGDRPTNHGKQ